MNMKMLSLVLLVCGTFPFVYSHGATQISVKSHIFEPLRPKHPPKSISECNTVVTEPYGLLQKTYKRGEAKEGATCTWTLRAPANHVVNVISMSLILEDEIPAEKHSGDYRGSLIYLYNSSEAGKNFLTLLSAADNQHAGSAFVQSTSNQPDMTVEIKYHDSPGFATQKLAVKYEFLNVDDMNRLLREQNAKSKAH